MQKLDRNTISFGACAAVGVTQTILMKQYVDTYGPIPFIGDYLPYPWGNWSTFGNILIGGVAFGVSQFTGAVKNNDIRNFLGTYGLTTLVGGVLNGVFTNGAPAARRAGARRLVARAAPQVARAASVAPLTPTGISPATILA